MTDSATPVEATPQGVSTPSGDPPQTCLLPSCGIPLVPNKRGQAKLFCCGRHRAAYRDQQVQHAISEAMDAVQEAGYEMARLSARLEGARLLLERYQRHGKRTTRKDLTRPDAGTTVGPAGGTDA